MVFVFATLTMVNANSNTSELKSGDCTADAWEFGTGWDSGDPYWEWYWTDRYFEYFCNDDGTYK
ncbi:hypothetical protein [Lutibacter sp.]